MVQSGPLVREAPERLRNSNLPKDIRLFELIGEAFVEGIMMDEMMVSLENENVIKLVWNYKRDQRSSNKEFSRKGPVACTKYRV